MSQISYLEKLYKVRNNVLDMLIDRKYNNEHIEKHYKNIDFKKFTQLYKDDQLNIKVKHTSKNNICIVKFINTKFKKENLLDIIESLKGYIEEKSVDIIFNLIIITSNKPSSNIINLIYNLSNKKIKIEHFEFSELLFNKTKHILVPQHILLTEKEKEKVLRQYNCSVKQLPRIIITRTIKTRYVDPIAKYYGANPGDVFKIIRKSETGGEYISYRAAK